jgi:hypothetical protein
VHTTLDDESTSSTPSLADSPAKEGTADVPHHERGATEASENPAAAAAGTLRGRFKTGLGVFLPSALKDDDRGSIKRKSRPKQTVHGRRRSTLSFQGPLTLCRRLASISRDALTISVRSSPEGCRGPRCSGYHTRKPVARNRLPLRNLRRRPVCAPECSTLRPHPRTAPPLRADR